ncbi:hypothetical protein BBJ28_00024438, partial [Nothophytophthora sp. Chile5]
MAPTQEAIVPVQVEVPGQPFRGIRMGPDQRSQSGEVICGLLDCGVVAAVELPRDTSERETVNEIVISEEGHEDSESDEDRSSEVPIHDGAGLRAGRASPEVGDAAAGTGERKNEVAVMKETPLPLLVGSKGPNSVSLERENAGLSEGLSGHEVQSPVVEAAGVLSDGLSEDKPPPQEERSPAEVESTVFENVAVRLSENPEIGESETFVCAVRGFENRAFPGEASPALRRSLARQALYHQLSGWLRPDSDAVGVPQREKTFPPGGVSATEDVEPFRDKVPELDLGRARTWVHNAPCGTILRESEVDDVMQKMKEYDHLNSSTIWGILRRRRARPREQSADPVARKRRRHVCFDCSSLFPERSEAMTALSSRPDEEDDLGHYVSVVRPDEDEEERPA